MILLFTVWIFIFHCEIESFHRTQSPLVSWLVSFVYNISSYLTLWNYRSHGWQQSTEQIYLPESWKVNTTLQHITSCYHHSTSSCHRWYAKVHLHIFSAIGVIAKVHFHQLSSVCSISLRYQQESQTCLHGFQTTGFHQETSFSLSNSWTICLSLVLTVSRIEGFILWNENYYLWKFVWHNFLFILFFIYWLFSDGITVWFDTFEYSSVSTAGLRVGK